MTVNAIWYSRARVLDRLPAFEEAQHDPASLSELREAVQDQRNQITGIATGIFAQASIRRCPSLRPPATSARMRPRRRVWP